MLSTVCFDLGNVICFFSHEKMFSQMSECLGISVDEIKCILQNLKLQERYESGKIDTVQLYKTFASISPKTFTLDAFSEAIADIFVPNTALWPIIEGIKERGLKLILISNTCECHYRWIAKRYPIMRLFDYNILSFEVGFMKPDPRIFQKAVEIAGSHPSKCFYTDDIPAFIESARRVGLDGEVYINVLLLKEHLKKRGVHF